MGLLSLYFDIPPHGWYVGVGVNRRISNDRLLQHKKRQSQELALPYNPEVL